MAMQARKAEQGCPEGHTAAIKFRASGKEFNAVLYNNRAGVHLFTWQYPMAVADSFRAIALDEEPQIQSMV